MGLVFCESRRFDDCTAGSSVELLLLLVSQELRRHVPFSPQWPVVVDNTLIGGTLVALAVAVTAATCLPIFALLRGAAVPPTRGGCVGRLRSASFLSRHSESKGRLIVLAACATMQPNASTYVVATPNIQVLRVVREQVNALLRHGCGNRSALQASSELASGTPARATK